MVMLEFSKLLVGAWLVVICFHGLFETISERRAERYLYVLVYAITAFVYAVIGTGIWLCLLLFAQSVGHEFSCFGVYKQRRPSAYALVYANILPVAIAGIFAISHALCVLYKRFISRNSRFAGVRWFIQSVIHLIICLSLVAVWYYDLWLPVQHEPDVGVYELPVEGVFIVALAGFVVSVIIGLAQCFLPAKETMRL